MRKSVVLVILILAILTAGCGNEALRNADKFSPLKKYAVIPFGCNNKEISLGLAKSLREWLVTFDYEVIEQEELDTLLRKSGLTAEDIQKNYLSAVNTLKGVDAIILGFVNMDKKDPNLQNLAGSSHTEYDSQGHPVVVKDKSNPNSAGGMINFISSCQVYVVDLKGGDILARGVYEAPANTVFGGSLKIDDISKRLAIELSPH